MAPKKSSALDSAAAGVVPKASPEARPHPATPAVRRAAQRRAAARANGRVEAGGKGITRSGEGLKGSKLTSILRYCAGGEKCSRAAWSTAPWCNWQHV